MKNEPLLIDTDIGPDCDDAGALAIAYQLANKGYCHVLGVSHCTSSPYSAGAIDAIGRYYGHENVPIAGCCKSNFLDTTVTNRYSSHIFAQCPHRFHSEQPEDMVRMYRRLMAEEADHSVICVGIGPLVNLAALLESAPDEYSPLNGEELVAKKVKSLTLMGGVFENFHQQNELPNVLNYTEGKNLQSFAEWNIAQDVAAAQMVATRWHTPKCYVGFEAGLFNTGSIMKDVLQENHPVRMAYHFAGFDDGRSSWDLVAMESAILTDSPFYIRSQPGWITFGNDGETCWQANPDGTDCYIEPNVPVQELARHLDHYLAAE